MDDGALPAPGRTPLIVVLCGLPGTGKSALARRLAPALGAALLDKDRVREALFGPDGVEHSREQDDLCCRLMYEAAAWLLLGGRRVAVVLDGRTYTRAGQLDPVIDLARRTGSRLAVVGCRCAPEEARARLERDRRGGLHPARDRTPDLHQRLAAEAVPPPAGSLLLDTDQAHPAELTRRVLAWLATCPPDAAAPRDGPG